MIDLVYYFHFAVNRKVDLTLYLRTILVSFQDAIGVCFIFVSNTVIFDRRFHNVCRFFDHYRNLRVKGMDDFLMKNINNKFCNLTQEQSDAIYKSIEANQATCDGTGSARISQRNGAGFGQGMGMGAGTGQRNGGCRR